MPSCCEVARQLSDLRDREVSGWQRVRLRLHLWMCAPCARVERSLGATVELLRKLGEESQRPR